MGKVMAKKKAEPKEESPSHGEKMVRISEELHERLKASANANHRPLSWQLELYLEKGLEADGFGKKE